MWFLWMFHSISAKRCAKILHTAASNEGVLLTYMYNGEEWKSGGGGLLRLRPYWFVSRKSQGERDVSLPAPSAERDRGNIKAGMLKATKSPSCVSSSQSWSRTSCWPPVCFSFSTLIHPTSHLWPTFLFFLAFLLVRMFNSETSSCPHQTVDYNRRLYDLIVTFLWHWSESGFILLIICLHLFTEKGEDDLLGINIRPAEAVLFKLISQQCSSSFYLKSPWWQFASTPAFIH